MDNVGRMPGREGEKEFAVAACAKGYMAAEVCCTEECKEVTRRGE